MKAKLSKADQMALQNAAVAGLWSGNKGISYENRPKKNKQGPLFEKPQPKQTSLW
jgi:hypothetical protein